MLPPSNPLPRRRSWTALLGTVCILFVPVSPGRAGCFSPCGGVPAPLCQPCGGPILLCEPPSCESVLDDPEVSADVLAPPAEWPVLAVRCCETPTGHATFFGPALGGAGSSYFGPPGGPGGAGGGSGGAGGGSTGRAGGGSTGGGSHGSAFLSFPGTSLLGLSPPAPVSGLPPSVLASSPLSEGNLLGPPPPGFLEVPPGSGAPPGQAVHQNPEPATLVLFGLGVAGLAAYRGLRRERA
jgi:hypothetical protein